LQLGYFACHAAITSGLLLASLHPWVVSGVLPFGLQGNMCFLVLKSKGAASFTTGAVISMVGSITVHGFLIKN
jgi:hypothetical protein